MSERGESPEGGLRWRTSGSGPSVALLIHGYPFFSALWEAQLAAVPPGWRFIAPDLPGFGDSPPPTRMPMTLDDVADELVLLLEKLGVRRAVVCGLSMGGYVAFRLWARHSARIAGLVLAHTRARPDEPEVRLGRYETASRARAEGVGFLADAMLPRLLSPETFAERPAVVERLRAIIASATVPGVVAALGAMAERPDSTDLLPGIRVPALVIAGAGDAIAPPAEMEGMVAAMPAARFMEIPGVAHVSCMEAPAVFNAALASFLRGLDLT